MRNPFRALPVRLFYALTSAATLMAAPPFERSLSPSGQFIVYGGDAARRGAICGLAEQTKSDLLAILQRRDQWATPIVIDLQSRATNLPEIPAFAFRFSQTGSGLKLQLDLTISRETNSGAIEREILRAILLEMIYRNQTGIASGETYVDPPSWLMDGLLSSMPNRDRASVVNALAVSEQIAPLDRFLHESPELLDSIGRSVYGGYSFALVQLLIDSQDGRTRLGRYIDNLAFASNDPLADLQTAFPKLGESDLQKRWQSKISELKNSADDRLLTFSQTDAKLNELLHSKFPGLDGRDKSVSLEGLSQRKLTSTQSRALQKFSQELLLLNAHANPVLRPVVQDYQQLVTQLALGRNGGVAARLSELRTLGRQLTERMTEIDDYMNWFEATQLPTQSGLFEDYLNASNAATLPTTHRKDAFSTYLDAMESEF